MDANDPRPDDLSDLERRLSAWQPSAAGRASARGGRGRVLWPLASACLAVLAVVLGVGLAAERAERLELARRLPGPPTSPVPPRVPDMGEAAAADPLAPNAYLHVRRELERDPDAWPKPAGGGAEPPGPPGPPVLRVWDVRRSAEL